VSIRLEVDDEAHPSTQIHGSNQRKKSANREIENQAKNTSKNHKNEKYCSSR
jgi:hypothetical protein